MISNSRDGDAFADGSFVSDTAVGMQLHNVPDGVGIYRVSVKPDSLGTSWYVEVDAFR